MWKYLIFLFLLFLIVLFSLKISISISFFSRNQAAKLSIQCILPMGIHFQIYPRRKKVGKPSKRVKKEMQAGEIDFQVVEMVLPILWESLKRLLSKLTCSKLDWHMQFGTGQADQTAELYGILSAFQYGMVGWFVNQTKKNKHIHINLTPLFTEKHFHTSFLCMVHFRLGDVIAIPFYFIKEIRKQNRIYERNESYGTSNSRIDENSIRKFR